MTKVKICGISNNDSALVAARAGADLLGILFEPHSRRYVPEEEARGLVQHLRAFGPQGGPRWVGVFANQPLEEVNHLLEQCDLDMAQLSGHESLDYCSRVIRPVVKVLHVRDDVEMEEVLRTVDRSLREYLEAGHMCLLDTFKAGVLGGTGQVFDWEVAQELARSHSLLLAGGLTPENVSDALRLVRPWGLDVSSGVESDEEKDTAKIARFISEVRRADRLLALGEPDANRKG